MEEVLGVFGIKWKLVVIQIVNFGLLLLILHYFLYKPVLNMINKRKEKIDKGVKDAEDAKKQLESISEEKRSVLASATKEAEAMLDLSRSKSKELEERLKKEAEKKQEQILDLAKIQARELKKRMIEESKKDIARMAILGAEKILRK